MPYGKLYLIPSWLGEQSPELVLPNSVQQVVDKINHFIVENEKTARYFIKKICPQKVQASFHCYLMAKHTDKSDSASHLKICLQGYDIGVISEAGVPTIADPGSHLVRKAHELGIQVVPLVGPSSILLAMMSSGLNGQNFAFVGYLPIDESERKKKIQQLERRSIELNQSQICIETPFRNQKLFGSFTTYLHPQTLLCVATDITLETEFIKTQNIQDWKKQAPELHKRPTIFIIQGVK